MAGIIKFFFNIFALINVQEFRQRFISAIVLFFLLIILLLLGNPLLSMIFCLLFSFLFYEYEKLTSSFITKLKIFKILSLQLLLILFTFFEIYEFQFLLFFNNFIIFICASILINIIFLIYNRSRLINFILSNLIIFSFFSLMSVLQKPNGFNFLIYVVILVSTMDIFAYFGGKLLGKNKIIPKISKGKTIEGTLIGVVFTIVVSFLIKDLMYFDILNSVIYGFIISCLAFLGDLIESIFKRNLGVKDSGKLIPGHGGLLDRFDGYFLVLPFLYIFIY